MRIRRPQGSSSTLPERPPVFLPIPPLIPLSEYRAAKCLQPCCGNTGLVPALRKQASRQAGRPLLI